MNIKQIFFAFFLLFILIVIYRFQESFDTNSQIEIHPDLSMQNFLNNQNQNQNQNETESEMNETIVTAKDIIQPTNKQTNNPDQEPELDMSQYVLKSSIEPKKPGPDLTQFIRRTDVERVATNAAKEACPVDRDFDKNQWIKKTEIPPQDSHCPKLPDLKDFVLKTTIPPAQKCASCICPKVKVSAGLCKKIPEKKFICPAPKPCGINECKKIIKCMPGTVPVPPPPICPEVKPCPKLPVQVCPPCTVPPPVKCPIPKPCSIPPPCPSPERCSPAECKPCKYYGVKRVSEKSIEEIIDDLYKKGYTVQKK